MDSENGVPSGSRLQRDALLPLGYLRISIPKISRIFCRCITSRGERPFVSSHFVKSPSFTSCSTRTSDTDTFTTPCPSANPDTHSFPRIAANPCATASYKLLAVTSTVCDTRSKSGIVTRQVRVGITAKYHIRFLFAMPIQAPASSRQATTMSKDRDRLSRAGHRRVAQAPNGTCDPPL